MKYMKLINILPISFFIFALLALPAMAVTHTTTGNIYNDWGVNLSKAYADDSNIDLNNNPFSYDGWKPKDSSIDWIVENNIGPQYHTGQLYYGGWDLFKWAGAKYGTHKMKNGIMDSAADYVEPLINCTDQNQDYIQPAGGEAYDIEALYFDDDPKNVSLAIVTSVASGGTSDGWMMGDIALDINSTDGTVNITDGTKSDIIPVPYEYGIKVLTGKDISTNKDITSGSIIYQPKWTTPPKGEFPKDYPLTIQNGTIVGTVNKIVYTSDNVPSDNGFSNSVIEVNIPRNKLGNPSKDQLSNIHLSIGCGNDIIDLSPVKFKTDIPEFPSVVLPVSAVLGIILILGRRNKE